MEYSTGIRPHVSLSKVQAPSLLSKIRFVRDAPTSIPPTPFDPIVKFGAYKYINISSSQSSSSYIPFLDSIWIPFSSFTPPFPSPDLSMLWRSRPLSIYSQFFHPDSPMDFSDKMQRCHDYIEALEEERRKIQVFQRELPLCLELVSQGIVYSQFHPYLSFFLSHFPF